MKKAAKRTLIVVAVLILAAAAWAARELRHGYDATVLAASLAGIDSPLPDHRPSYSRETFDFVHMGTRYVADRYLPDVSGPVRAGLLLVPGAAPDGRRDARLVDFAGELARSGFVVLVPDVRSLRELRLTPASADEIAASFVALAGTRELAAGARLGMGAFSVATGPVLLAALQPGLRGSVDFLLLVGGYHDLPRTLRYMTTGQFGADGDRGQRAPDRYGKWVYALSNARLLEDEQDRELLSAIAAARLEDSSAPVESLAELLGPGGRAVYEFVENEDPARFDSVLEGLPDTIRSDMAALDIATRDLTSIEACFILVHGLDDAVIPYTESVSLDRALPPDRGRLFLLSGLHHVDRDISDWRDGWRMWRALQLLLAQRSAGNARGCP